MFFLFCVVTNQRTKRVINEYSYIYISHSAIDIAQIWTTHDILFEDCQKHAGDSANMWKMVLWSVELFLALEQSALFGRNPALLITLRTMTPQRSTVVVVSWRELHLASWLEH